MQEQENRIDEAYHRLGHGLANARTAAGAEKDFALEDIVLEDRGGIHRRWFDVTLGHGVGIVD